jgi:hypothetical protein
MKYQILVVTHVVSVMYGKGPSGTSTAMETLEFETMKQARAAHKNLLDAMRATNTRIVQVVPLYDDPTTAE